MVKIVSFQFQFVSYAQNKCIFNNFNGCLKGICVSFDTQQDSKTQTKKNVKKHIGTKRPDCSK